MSALAALEDRSHPAWQRLKFDELLAQQLSQLQAKRERERAARAGAARRGRGGLHEQLLAALPFALTARSSASARRSPPTWRARVPMHRLLQGDVGSGKTVVAALAAAHRDRRRLAVRADGADRDPGRAALPQAGRLAGAAAASRVAWLTGSRKGKARDEMLALVASGEAALVVGTHAVIQDAGAVRASSAWRSSTSSTASAWPAAGAARASWRAQALEPHLLMMSATPIPRTLAMSYFADLDVRTIDELPPGRTPVVTKLFADSRRDEVIARIRDEVAQGRQVYWVCPLIEESEALDLQNATETHAAAERGAARRDGRPAARPHAGGREAAVMALFTGGQMARAGVAPR